MKLDVPLYHQKDGSYDCGPICLRMLLSYYGRDIGDEEIIQSFTYLENGISIPELGSYMLKNGFDAEIVTLNPHLFSYNMLGLSDQAAIRQHLANRILQHKKEERKIVNQHMIDFMDQGGTLRLKIPDAADLHSELEAGRPVLASMITLYLEQHCGYNFHFTIVTGLDADHVYVNDPLKNETKPSQYAWPRDGFFYAMHCAAFGDVDNDSLLLLRPKN